MATIFPFKGLRPAPELAAQVAAVPYDVVSRREAEALARDNPNSFLHVTRPEIDLGAEVAADDARVYAQGASALQRLEANGVLRRDETPNLYVYQLVQDGHAQTGVVLCASVEEYDRNLVRKHEYTRPEKEDDRVRHMEVLDAQSGTVFLLHRDSEALRNIVADITAAAPAVDFLADDGVRHRLWVVADGEKIEAIVRGFHALGPVYIADGHHRSAAAARVAHSRRTGPGPEPGSEAEKFLAVSFPASELRVLPYNRVVKDLGAHDVDSFLKAIAERFALGQGKLEPLPRHHFNMYIAGCWYHLGVPEGSYDPEDPVARLDVSLLQKQLLEPVLGIADPRRDERIDFVGGIRGDAALQARVEAGWAVAFALHPTEVDDLLAIADAGATMPPKSTWFEPKLRDGLVVHTL